jgi:hypothetical protein
MDALATQVAPEIDFVQFGIIKFRHKDTAVSFFGATSRCIEIDSCQCVLTAR